MLEKDGRPQAVLGIGNAADYSVMLFGGWFLFDGPMNRWIGFSFIGTLLVLLVFQPKDKKKKEDQPKKKLGIMDLSDGKVTVVERVKSFKMPEEAGGWVAYLKEEAPKSKDKAEKAEEGEEAKKPEEKAEEEEAEEEE